MINKYNNTIDVVVDCNYIFSFRFYKFLCITIITIVCYIILRIVGIIVYDVYMALHYVLY